MSMLKFLACNRMILNIYLVYPLRNVEAKGMGSKIPTSFSRIFLLFMLFTGFWQIEALIDGSIAADLHAI
jgi:hypothetical protein